MSFMNIKLCTDCRNRRVVWEFDKPNGGPCHAVPDAATLRQARGTCGGDLWEADQPRHPPRDHGERLALAAVTAAIAAYPAPEKKQ